MLPPQLDLGHNAVATPERTCSNVTVGREKRAPMHRQAWLYRGQKICFFLVIVFALACMCRAHTFSHTGAQTEPPWWPPAHFMVNFFKPKQQIWWLSLYQWLTAGPQLITSLPQTLQAQWTNPGFNLENEGVLKGLAAEGGRAREREGEEARGRSIFLALREGRRKERLAVKKGQSFTSDMKKGLNRKRD